jgi:TonB family protein
MNRTEKNSLIGSSVLHGLVVGVLLLSSLGFMTNKDDEMVGVQILETIDPDALEKLLTDGETRGGASPAAPEVPPSVQPAAPTVAAPVQPPPQPRPIQPAPTPPPVQPRPEPKPEPVEVKTPPAPVPDRNPRVIDTNVKTPAPKKPEPKPEPKPAPKPERVINIADRTRVDRQDSGEQRRRDEQRAAEREAEQRRRQLANSFSQAIDGVATGTGRPTEGIRITGGGGGEAALNYGDYIRSELMRLWQVPSSATPSMQARATVTIASDGRVTSTRITSRSGNAAFDASVEATLKRFTKVNAFPAGATDSSRTYTIQFQPRSSQGTG